MDDDEDEEEKSTRPPEIVRILGTAVIFFALEALRPNDWVSGNWELLVFFAEALVGLYIIDGIWELRAKRRRRDR
nr:hypothetical protein [Micromonospora sp. DSM 115978]